MTDNAAIIDRAIDWHLRQPTMTEEAWADFVAWLEADPAHARAYDGIAMADRAMPVISQAVLSQAGLPTNVVAGPMRAANDDQPAPRRWRWAAAGVAVAAGIVAMVSLTPPGESPYSVSTAPGQTRTIALADGTRIDLSGATHLTLDRNDPRVASLDAGQATFRVRHDDGAPFTLRSGALAVRDLGTVFDVVRSGARLDVQVAEGSVMFQPGGEAIVLTAGQTLTAREDQHRVTVGAVEPDAVGGWRQGRLSFAGESLDVVADAIRRRYGTHLMLVGDLSRQPFTGMIEMTGAAERDIPHLAALIGAEWRRDGEDWILAPRGAAAR